MMEPIGNMLPGQVRHLRVVPSDPEEARVAPFTPVPAVCPTCKGAGWLRDRAASYEGKTPMVKCPDCQDAQTAVIAKSLFGDAHIPWPKRDWTFDTYPVDADQQAKRRVENFVARAQSGMSEKRGLYLQGERGHCKTSLALSALQRVLQAGKSGCFITTIELFNLLRASIAASQRIARGDADFEDRYEESQGAKLLRLVHSVSWLVLDDLGVECGTKYVIQELYAIIEKRFSQGLYTIFTSNRDAKNLEQYWKPEGTKEKAFLDAMRIIDRLGEYCFAVQLQGRDSRRVNG